MQQMRRPDDASQSLQRVRKLQQERNRESRRLITTIRSRIHKGSAFFVLKSKEKWRAEMKKSDIFENLVMNFSIDTEELSKADEKKRKEVPLSGTELFVELKSPFKQKHSTHQ